MPERDSAWLQNRIFVHGDFSASPATCAVTPVFSFGAWPETILKACTSVWAVNPLPEPKHVPCDKRYFSFAELTKRFQDQMKAT